MKTAETDEEWSQLLRLTTSLYPKAKNMEVGEIGMINETVIRSCNVDQMFEFVKSEIAKGRTASQPLFKLWFESRFDPSLESPRPFPWKQVNEFTDLISDNFDAPGTLKFLEPMLSYIDGPEAGTYLTRFRKSRAGNHINQLAYSDDLQQRFEVFRIALEILDDDSIFKIYKSDLLNPKLNNSSVVENSFSKPWPVVRPDLFAELLNVLEPDFWAFNGYVDPLADAKYASEASDLLAKVTDGFLENRLVFSNWENKRASKKTTAELLEMTLQSFFDVAQRTDDEKIKELMLEKLETIKRSLASKPVAIPMSDLADLDYVIAYYKGETPLKLPDNSRLWVRDPQEATTSQIANGGQSEEVASASVVADPPLTPMKTKKPFYQGKTFDQWMQTARYDRDSKTQSAALIACAATMETDKERKALLDLTSSLARVHGSIILGVDKKSDQYYNAFMHVLDACDADQIFDFIKKEIVEGTSESRQLCSNWLAQVNLNDYSAAAFERGRKKRKRIQKRVTELTVPLSENIDEPWVASLLENLLPTGPDSDADLETLRNSAVGVKVKELIQTATPQKRFKTISLAFKLFGSDQQVLEAYERDLLDPELNDLLFRQGLMAKPWPVVRANAFRVVFDSLAPTDYSEKPKIEPDTPDAKRIASAAKLLTKVTDGILAKEDKRLLFNTQWYRGSAFIGSGGNNAPQNNRVEATQLMLQYFYNVALADGSGEISKGMLPSLKKLKASLNPESPSNDAMCISAQADLDYLIAYIKGVPPERLPNSTILWDKSRRNQQGGGMF